MTLKDLPIDLLQEASGALERYVRARRKSRLQEEQARLRVELQDMNTDLAEIQALSGGMERNLEEPALPVPSQAEGSLSKGENHA